MLRKLSLMINTPNGTIMCLHFSKLYCIYGDRSSGKAEEYKKMRALHVNIIQDNNASAEVKSSMAFWFRSVTAQGNVWLSDSKLITHASYENDRRRNAS